MDVKDPMLYKLVNEVIKRIPEKYNDNFELFYIYDGADCKWNAMVLGNTIYLDTNRLKSYDTDVILGIISHEIAHVYHHHADDPEPRQHESLDDECQADKTAKEWGFVKEIEKLRKLLGETTMLE